MILCDSQIAALCEQGLVDQYDPALVNPCSLDVRLGPVILFETQLATEFQQVSIADTTQEAPYFMAPGEFLLAATLERITVPDDCAVQFMLKSSRAREGIEHSLAGFADSGFSGILTLELSNIRRFHPIPIWHGMRIGQLVVHRLAEVPQLTYAARGHYQNDGTVQQSKGYFQ